MEGDRRSRDWSSPKTLSRWLRCSLLINGINTDIDLEDARDCAQMLVKLGRAVPSSQWVDYFVELGQEASLESLY